MNLQIFPKNVAETEIAYYLSKQNKYGLPLDNRETYTKTDWIMWTATLANDKATFEKFIEPVYLFMNVTPNRVPMSDWVFTDICQIACSFSNLISVFVGWMFTSILAGSTSK